MGTNGRDLSLKYTRKEWKRCKTTLETSGKDCTGNEWESRKTTLGTSGKDCKLHSERVGKSPNYTRIEWERHLKTNLEAANLGQKCSK